MPSNVALLTTRFASVAGPMVIGVKTLTADRYHRRQRAFRLSPIGLSTEPQAAQQRGIGPSIALKLGNRGWHDRCESGGMRCLYPLALISLFSLATAVGCESTEEDDALAGSAAGAGGLAAGGDASGGDASGGDADGGSGDVGGGGEATGTCAAGLSCVPASPLASSYFSRGASACPAPSEVDSWKACDVDACSCAPPTGMCDVGVYLTDNTQCSNLVEEVTTPGCFDATDGDFFIASIVSDSCASIDMPPDVLEGCTTFATDATPCDDGICVPDAPQQCIVVSAFEGCQDPVYSEEVDVYAGGGECTCYCGSDGGCEDLALVVSSDDDTCGGSTTTLPLDASCLPANNVRSIQSGPVADTGTACSASSASVSGSLAFTLCCTPE